MNTIEAYQTELFENKTKKIRYFFESKGDKSLTKVIEYSQFRKIKGKDIYNLGFGDYDEVTGNFFDDSNSNNGDMRQVFNTVLSTVPKFFKINPDSAIWVQGSDSSDKFIKTCKENCRKKCVDNDCKNKNKRIRTYRYYIDRNFKELSKEYTFFGVLNGEALKYVPQNEYVGVLVFKKK